LLEQVLLALSPVDDGWKILLEELGAFEDDLVGSLASGTASDSWLNAKDGIDDLLRLLVLESDVRVLMETKHFRVFNQRQLVNVVHVNIDRAICWRIIDSRLREFVPVIKDILVRVLLEESDEATAIPVVSDSASVIDLTGDIKHGIPGDLFLLVEEDTQHG